MQTSPLRILVSILFLAAITSTTVYPQTTKNEKGSSGDLGSSTGDQPGSDGTDDGSGGSKAGAKDASKNDDKSKGDTSKTGFDDGTYAEATAITYKAMQSIATVIADKRNKTADTFVVFDPVTFANIAQYRIQFPQVVMLRTSLCGTLTAMDNEKAAETAVRDRNATQEAVKPGAVGAGSSSASLSPAGQIVDLAQKVLTMMQTTTTIAGASVNITDEALVSEVAAGIHQAAGSLAVYYPGEFLLPDMDEIEINSAMTDPFCAGGQPLGQAHHIVAEIVRLGVARQEAANRYQLLTAALDKYNSIVNPSAKKANTEQPKQADPKDKTKNKGRGANGAAAAPAPAAPAASETAQPHVPTAQEKKDALDQFYGDTGFTNVAQATGYQANLKSYMDAYDALLTSLATPDAKGQTMFSKLVIAERLDAILKETAFKDAKNNTVTPVVNVVIVKWLRAGALNKTRKNLFFLGQRNYYAGGATALYEYFDDNQKMLASGTITETSPYVHDKDFDNKEKNKKIEMIILNP
jgi:hypothetical protein